MGKQPKGYIKPPQPVTKAQPLSRAPEHPVAKAVMQAACQSGKC